ncbi:hypothetical protein FB451DRAFT_1397861 [Mycena latifolia]|nr:hypothetical protein FB451DRAFT_1397861 [Mycena latifolia]
MHSDVPHFAEVEVYGVTRSSQTCWRIWHKKQEEVECTRVIDPILKFGPSRLFRSQLQLVLCSPSIVIAYLIRNHTILYDAACKCACAKPNPGFARPLIEWEHSWRRFACHVRPGTDRIATDVPAPAFHLRSESTRPSPNTVAPP